MMTTSHVSATVDPKLSRIQAPSLARHPTLPPSVSSCYPVETDDQPDQDMAALHACNMAKVQARGLSVSVIE
jgi:hypothetical protein